MDTSPIHFCCTTTGIPEIYIRLHFRIMFIHNVLFHPGIYYVDFPTSTNPATPHPFYYYIVLFCMCVCFQVTEAKYELTLTKQDVLLWKHQQIVSKKEKRERKKERKKGTLTHCWWECKMVRPPWKTVWKFLRKLKIELPFWVYF